MNKILDTQTIEVIPEDWRISLGFDVVDESQRFETVDYTIFEECIFVKSMDEDECYDRDIKVKVTIVVSEENNYEPPSGFKQVDTSKNNTLKIKKSKILGIFEMLEFGFSESDDQYINVEKYSEAVFQIYTNLDLTEILVFFFVK